MLASMLSLSSLPMLVVAASAPYVPLTSFAALVIALVYRRKALAVAVAILLTATVAIQLPRLFIARPIALDSEATEMRILSANIQKGRADARFFVDLAIRSADVISVPELTPEAVVRFRDAGLRKVFPHSVLKPRPGANGIGLWSRYPLVELSQSVHANSVIAARVRVPGLQHQPVVAAVHLTSPVASGANTFERWNSRITAAKAVFAEYADTAGPGAVIIAGDFNATVDMKQFRDLLTNGYRDGVNQTGAGFMPTYSPHPWIPPLLAIDHVLTRNSAVQSIHSVDVPGTDHRALVATVAIPRDAG